MGFPFVANPEDEILSYDSDAARGEQLDCDSDDITLEFNRAQTVQSPILFWPNQTGVFMSNMMLEVYIGRANDWKEVHSDVYRADTIPDEISIGAGMAGIPSNTAGISREHMCILSNCSGDGGFTIDIMDDSGIGIYRECDSEYTICFRGTGGAIYEKHTVLYLNDPRVYDRAVKVYIRAMV